MRERERGAKESDKVTGRRRRERASASGQGIEQAGRKGRERANGREGGKEGTREWSESETWALACQGRHDTANIKIL